MTPCCPSRLWAGPQRRPEFARLRCAAGSNARLSGCLQGGPPRGGREARYSNRAGGLRQLIRLRTAPSNSVRLRPALAILDQANKGLGLINFEESLAGRTRRSDPVWLLPCLPRSLTSTSLIPTCSHSTTVKNYGYEVTFEYFNACPPFGGRVGWYAYWESTKMTRGSPDGTPIDPPSQPREGAPPQQKMLRSHEVHCAGGLGHIEGHRCEEHEDCVFRSVPLPIQAVRAMA